MKELFAAILLIIVVLIIWNVAAAPALEVIATPEAVPSIPVDGLKWFAQWF